MLSFCFRLKCAGVLNTIQHSLSNEPGVLVMTRINPTKLGLSKTSGPGARDEMVCAQHLEGFDMSNEMHNVDVAS